MCLINYTSENKNTDKDNHPVSGFCAETVTAQERRKEKNIFVIRNLIPGSKHRLKYTFLKAQLKANGCIKLQG